MPDQIMDQIYTSADLARALDTSARRVRGILNTRDHIKPIGRVGQAWIYDKAAVLVCRLAWSHPLPDGNKRAAWASLVMFVDLNEGIWDPDPPDVDEAEQAMLAIAAGELDEGWTADWLRQRVRF